ncbi:MAG: hypothetical protein FI687_01375 [SAR202 cluster bacterium]|nr:hypothetical protein [SAR202 cluster bacterium]|tara:strand:+ start:452 stop:1207 length:756 start_codon:yes stop_codon:yes gene_type:complete
MSFKFIQMSDPQLGFYASRHPGVTGIDFEINNLSKAVKLTNKIKPDFVITTGDLTQDRLDSQQARIVKELYSQLNCKYYFASGNADLTNSPKFQDIERFRKRFGPDYYSFEYLNSQFIILNSTVLFDSKEVPGADIEQIEFLKNSLLEGNANNVQHQMIFMHHPLFGSQPNEENSEKVLPKTNRKKLLKLIESHNVTAVFTGHWHSNNIVKFKHTQLITSGPITFGLGKDPSGIRLIEVEKQQINHEYIPL